MTKRSNIYIVILLFVCKSISFSQCGLTTPSFTANLTGAPNATWTSPSVPRNDTCCGWSGSDQCIKFTILLNANSMGINFGFASGAVPPGALFYSINCGPPISVGTPICLSGAGPHILTFCKPGNNSNSYSISAIPAPVVPDSILVRNGCTQTISVSGFSVPTISWNSVNPGPPGTYNSFLNCTSACATVVASSTGTPPAFVDYEVSGYGQSPCQASFYKDTVRVYFYSDLLAGINPTLSTICAGSTNAILTATATGGLPSYTYSWSPGGSTSSVVTVGPGTYTVKVFDNTGCPPTTATAIVNQYTLPIVANAGPDQVVCKSSPSVALNGTVTNATGGAWSGGTGTFSPVSNSVSTGYIATAAELITGMQLYLTTTGNSGCPPKQDTINISFQNIPLANAGPDFTVCANNSSVAISGTVSGFSSTGQWSTNGSGVFSSTTNLNTTYTASAGDATTGIINIILTSTSNGVCAAARDTAKIIITPSPIVNAGTDQIICSTGSAALSGTVNGPTNTGNWSTTGDGSFTPASSQLNASYFPGPNDVATGSVTLVLASTGNGNCLSVKDTVKISIIKIATVTAGPSQTVCSSANSFTLGGSVTGGTATGVWSTGGSGSFSPSNSVLNAIYNITGPDKTAGLVSFTLTSANNAPCPIVTGTTSLMIIPLATVNAGPNQVLCSSTTSIALNGTVGGTGTGIWNSGGAGTFNPGNNNLSTSYNITAAETAFGSVTFSLSSTNNGPCPVVADTVKIVIIQTPGVTAGPSQSVCSSNASVSLTGTVSGGTGSGIIWMTGGSGTFSPSSNNLNTQYIISSADVLAGIVNFTLASVNNGPCPAATSTTSLQITPLATVNAGPNQILCSNASTVALTGTVAGTGSGLWSSGGSGTFNPGNANLSTTYNITPAEIATGSIIFTLTSTNNGPCAPASDTAKISIINIATVTAGPSQSICAATGSVTLNGNLTGGTGPGVFWTTSGSGSFNPAANILSPQYIISAGDVAAGIVTFSLTSANNGPCPATVNSTSLQITPLATVNAGPNQYLCSNAGGVILNGVINGVGTGSWSSSSTAPFNPSASSLNPSIIFTAADISAGFVTFTLTSTNNGACAPIADSVKISIAPLATVNAGPNKTICSTTGSVNLTGTVSGISSTGSWATSGSGSFNPNNFSLNTNYFISVSDLAVGSVTFTLSSTGNGPCPFVTDTMRVLIIPLASVNAGLNQYICSSTPTINLNGLVNSNTNSGTWATGGGGIFIPNNNSLNATYSISSSDALNGSVTLTLSASGNTPCPVVSDTVKIKIKIPAQVNAGPDQTICSTFPNVILSGTVNPGNSTAIWNTNGTGNFSPNNSVLNGQYNVSAADINSGSALLILTSTNNEVCPASTDTMKLSIIKKPVINLLSDTTICEYQNPLKVVANVSGGSGNYQWSTSGSGAFAFAGSVNAVNYTMSSSDIASGVIKLTITSINNGPCGSMNSSINVIIHPAPDAAFAPSALIANIPNDPIVFTNQSSGANSYFWNFGDGGFTNLPNPVHNFGTVGYYTVSLVASNQFGCKDTADVAIKVISDIQFPNVFTPNQNGSGGGSYNPADLSNDVFFPYTSGVTEYQLRIFNRWGEMIFESRDINVGWDGYFNGKLCQQDAYVWKADVKFFDGRKYNKTGNVTLLR